MADSSITYPRPSTNDSRDLAIAYRICPRIAKVAQSLPLGQSKLQQAAVCLSSFRKSLGSLRIKLWAILDGCPCEYQRLFEDHFAPEDLVVLQVDHLGNRGTFAKQIDILLSQQDADLVYFAEDDYLYLAGQFPRMVDFLHTHADVDFISPYDHPDCYRLQLHRESKWLRVHEGHHWRTASSTCLTFLTRKTTLARYERTFRTYASRNNDCALWLSLTRHRVYNPFLFAAFLASRNSDWQIIAKAWRYCWPQILSGRTATLWAPVPSIATHLCAGHLSPATDWITLMQQEAYALSRSHSDLSAYRHA